jgi:hypothetical protein
MLYHSQRPYEHPVDEVTLGALPSPRFIMVSTIEESDNTLYSNTDSQYQANPSPDIHIEELE